MTIIHDETYSTRFAANRAGERVFGPGEYLVIKAPGDEKRYAIQKGASQEAKGEGNDAARASKKKPAAPNKTRAAQVEKAKAKKAEKKAAKGAKADKLGKRAQIVADAETGKLPPVPDFSSATHERFRPKLAELVALVKDKDIPGLKKFPINPISTSPKALDRYRNLAVVALTAQIKAEARS
jgi:hypothetical protein